MNLTVTKFARCSTAESLAAGSGTVWRGTRLAVTGPFVESKRYVALANADATASDTTVTVSIRAERPGPGTAIALDGSSALSVRVDDPIWDTTWEVASLECSDGTEFEPAAVSRARFRDGRRAARVGFVESMVAACKDAGAVNAVLFPADYGGDDEDQGLNVAYVGDGGFSASPALVRAVALKLESYRVLGDNLQVLPLTRSNLVIRARVNLWDAPARVNTTALRTLLVGAIRGYFDGASGGFSYDRDALGGAMTKTSSAVQSVSFDAPASDLGVLATIGGRLNFPSSLARYQVRAEDITLTFLPPA